MARCRVRRLAAAWNGPTRRGRAQRRAAALPIRRSRQARGRVHLDTSELSQTPANPRLARYDRREGAMRLPRFRAKLWMLVVLVALVALGFGAERTVRRVRAARANVAYHVRMETWCREDV